MDYSKGLESKHIRLETIHVDENSNSTFLSKKSSSSKKSHEKQKRKVKVEKNDNSETLVISQQVKVKKKKIQCIINLTNICDHQHSRKKCKKARKRKRKKEVSKPKSLVIDLKSNSQAELKSPQVKLSPKPKQNPKVDIEAKVERVAPHCLRRKCEAALSRKYRSLQLSRRKKEKTRSSDIKPSKHHTRSEKKRLEKKHRKVLERCLSPISLTSLKEYSALEDISSGSFCSDEDLDLDILIKRTKDRERESKLFEYNPHVKASTPTHIEASDTETLHIQSEDDNSMHSVETLVLEPQEDPQLDPEIDLYSPTYPIKDPQFEEPENNSLSLFNNQIFSQHAKYSAAIETTFYKQNIKEECDVDVLDKYFCKDDGQSINFKKESYSYSASENPNTNSDLEQILRIKEENDNGDEIGTTENDLYRIPLVKQEKDSSRCIGYSPSFPREDFNENPDIVPNTKVENNIDFSNFAEINTRIKTEVNELW